MLAAGIVILDVVFLKMTTKWVRPWSVMTCAIAGRVKSLKKFSRSTRTAAVLKPSSLAAFCRPTRFVPFMSVPIISRRRVMVISFL